MCENPNARRATRSFCLGLSELVAFETCVCDARASNAVRYSVEMRCAAVFLLFVVVVVFGILRRASVFRSS